MGVAREVGAKGAKHATRPLKWRRILGMTLVAGVATLILLAAGIYRHDHELRAPFEKRHWHRARKGGPSVYLTLTPSRVAMACTMVESGGLLGMSRVDVFGMLGQPFRVLKVGVKDPRISEIISWDVDGDGLYGSLFARFDSNGIAQEAWVGEKWTLENRLPLQVSRSGEQR